MAEQNTGTNQTDQTQQQVTPTPQPKPDGADGTTSKTTHNLMERSTVKVVGPSLPKEETTGVPPAAQSEEERKVPAGVPPTPSKEGETVPSTQQPVTTQTPPVTDGQTVVTRDTAQKRIDRMYARLQTERQKRFTAEAQVAANTPQPTGDGVEGDDATQPQPQPLTENQVEVILQRKEREKEFRGTETDVLMRHPSALHDDGSFNFEDPFCQKYIEVGRRNPHLATMVDGPLLAEAMAEKEMGTGYQKGRVDEAQHLQAGNNAFTASSTTRPMVQSQSQLTDGEKKVAARMGMTEAEYIVNKNKTRVL